MFLFLLTQGKNQICFCFQVIGNMAAAMGAASPALKTAVIQCMNQPTATLEVQQAAIQAYRQTPVPEEASQTRNHSLVETKSSTTTKN